MWKLQSLTFLKMDWEEANDDCARRLIDKEREHIARCVNGLAGYVLWRRRTGTCACPQPYNEMSEHPKRRVYMTGFAVVPRSCCGQTSTRPQGCRTSNCRTRAL